MKTVTLYISAILFTLILGIDFCSCTNEEDYSEDTNVKLQFSSDTVSFDTVFTTIGSVTKSVTVYNNEDKPLKINCITLASGSSSYFRLNVDGDSSLVARDIEIAAKDSMFIFVRVEINPNNRNNPVLVEDSIMFTFNDHTQSLLLMAYGQDAYYHKPTHTLGNTPDGIPYSMAHEGGEESGVTMSGYEITWKNDKPHVIIGTCAVDSLYTLNLTDGTQVYMGNDADLWIYTGGSMKAAGSVNNPVVFQSLRFQDRYSSIPGQWGKIWFWPGSMDNTLDNVLIKNATNGILADSCVTSSPTVTVSNTRIENCSSTGLYARGATLLCTNLIVQNTGSYAVALAYGGDYRFYGCTFANYWSYDNNRSKATLILNDWYSSSGSTQLRPISAEFYNSIIYGNLQTDEVELDLIGENVSYYKFDHCLIKSTLLDGSANAISCVLNRDPLFFDATNNDLHVKSNSPALANGDGVWNSLVPYDIFGVFRLDPPTIGAIESAKDE